MYEYVENYLMYINDLKLLAKNKKERIGHIDWIRDFNEDIGMEFGVENDERKLSSNQLCH